MAAPGLGWGVDVGRGVADGGMGVGDGRTGVSVGGTRVGDGGAGVADGGMGVADGGTDVADGGMGVADGGAGVGVGGTGVADGGVSVAVAGWTVGDAASARAAVCGVGVAVAEISTMGTLQTTQTRKSGAPAKISLPRPDWLRKKRHHQVAKRCRRAMSWCTADSEARGDLTASRRRRTLCATRRSPAPPDMSGRRSARES